MTARDLCKLDGQSPLHIGAGQKPDGPRDRTDMFIDLSVRPTLSGLPRSRDELPSDIPLSVIADRPDLQAAQLRRAHAQGELQTPRLLDQLARLYDTQRIDLTLTPPDPALHGMIDPALCLRLQCLPWRETDGTLWIATARPEDFDRTARQVQALLPEVRIIKPVLASRTAIQDHIAQHNRDWLTRRMTTRTPAQLSARHWSILVQIIALIGAIGCVAMIWTSGLGAFASFLANLAIVAVGVASMLKIAAAATHLARPGLPLNPAPPPPGADLPVVSILVPLYRETSIASALLQRLARLTYPPDKLDILLVLEETDTTTRDAIGAATLPPWMRVITVPDGQPRTKPRAMNYALDFAQGEIIGVYDAEDAPDPDQILKVVSTFATEPLQTACLQGALDYYNADRNWITRCFTIEYNTWFRLLMPGMAKLGFAVPLGGTTIFFRREALEQVGAWDAHNVTEDADLGMRLARFGYRTKVIDTTTGEEASATPLGWMRQRSRWLKGYLMTYAVHMRHPTSLLRDLGLWKFIGFQAHFLTAILHFALAPMLWLYWLVLLGVEVSVLRFDMASDMKWVAFCLIGFEVLVIALGGLGTWRREHRHLWPWLPTLHFYWPMGCVAMWKALYELATKPFYWDKTPHGLSPPTPRSYAPAKTGTEDA
ncbi:glycosyltransferase family 2 protein [Pseudooceanicola sp. MF1-13]|uniref:glycosyltransferase family 2 protein n=1 Tax=Pseudooceanicola sp. MF1-13 TaxID=3379095 RepID=UPI003891F3A4